MIRVLIPANSEFQKYDDELKSLYQENQKKICDTNSYEFVRDNTLFYAFLENDYKIKEKITFDDHHQYVLSDIENIEGDIITTEKDAVKLALLGYSNIYALKLKTSFDIENIMV